MNTKSLFAIALIAAAGAASASDHDGLDQFPVVKASAPVSTLTRAEVKAQVLQARANGSLDATSDHVLTPSGRNQSAVAGLTREQVRAELLKARAARTLTSSYDSPYGPIRN